MSACHPKWGAGRNEVLAPPIMLQGGRPAPFRTPMNNIIGAILLLSNEFGSLLLTSTRSLKHFKNFLGTVPFIGNFRKKGTFFYFFIYYCEIEGCDFVHEVLFVQNPPIYWRDFVTKLVWKYYYMFLSWTWLFTKSIQHFFKNGNFSYLHMP